MKLGFERLKTLAELTQRLTVVLGQLFSRVTVLEENEGSAETPDGSITSPKLASDINFVNMPTVVGNPIIESGSNANGSWTKFSDGTMICHHVLPYNATTSPAGSLDKTLETTWTYPETFISANVVIAANDSSSTELIMTARSVDTTSGRFKMFCYTPISGTRTARIMATGRWV